MNIRKKLSLATSLILIFFTASLGYTAYRWYVTVQLQQLQTESYKLIAKYNLVKFQTKSVQISQYDMSLLTDLWNSSIDDLQQTLAGFQDLPGQRYLAPEIQEKVQSTGSIWHLVMQDVQQARETLETIQEDPNYSTVSSGGLLSSSYYQLQDDPRKYASLILAINNLRTNMNSIELTSSKFATLLDEISKAVNVKVSRALQRSVLLISAISAVLIVFTIIYITLFTRNFSRRIRYIQANMERVADLDLTTELVTSSSDEIASLGKNLNTALQAIRDFIRMVHQSVDNANDLQDTLAASTEESVAALNQIAKNIESINKQFINLNSNITNSANSVTEMDSKIGDISEQINQQYQSVSESSSSIEEMTASIQSVAELSTDRKEKAEQLMSYVHQGGENVDETNEIIKMVSKDISQMLDIIEIINNVSEQTDLLSMNAAIESAHAGEAGRGFSVVAEEIRKLAESTSENVQVIDSTLHRVTDNIEKAAKASNQSAESFDTINRDVSSFVDAMAEIQSSMTELAAGSKEVLQSTHQVSELSTSLNEDSSVIKSQADSIGEAMDNLQGISSQATTGIQEIDIGTKEILNNFTEISNVSRNNTDQIGSLQKLLQMFKVDDGDAEDAEDAEKNPEEPGGSASTELRPLEEDEIS